ncbi:Iron-sulfur cluster assembly protein CyaY [Buchnera aphidicola (Periphyllus testudinaceus)]|uniref:iron donor protein CyaY n=1 Tax=Buchnera aphidicola TaxID=9 RepID=UPI0034641729
MNKHKNVFKFNKIVNKIIYKLEKSLDNYSGNIDIDYESYNNIMKIQINLKNEIIISRQEFLKQIWIATKYKGYHFQYYKNKWFCKRNKCEIFSFLKNFFKKKTGTNILKNFNKIKL